MDECYQNKWLTLKTKKHILYDIMIGYLPTLLFNKYVARIENYEIAGYKNNIKRYFPPKSYWLTWICVPLVPFKMVARRLHVMLQQYKTEM